MGKQKKEQFKITTSREMLKMAEEKAKASRQIEERLNTMWIGELFMFKAIRKQGPVVISVLCVPGGWIFYRVHAEDGVFVPKSKTIISGSQLDQE